MALKHASLSFRTATMVKLNLAEHKVSLLGAWDDRTCSPIDIVWSSAKIMVFGVDLGPGNLEDDNWRPLYFGWPNQSSAATSKEFPDFKKMTVDAQAREIIRCWLLQREKEKLKRFQRSKQLSKQ